MAPLHAAARDPVILVVSGPSGSGKDSLVEGLRGFEPSLRYSVSATTRPPRPGEIEGQHYFFVDRAEFDKMHGAGEFLETREYAGNWYGTPKAFVVETLRSGADLVMKPEVNGAMAVKRAFPVAVLVFVTAPSEAVLRDRLERRSTEAPDAIKKRLAVAQAEAESAASYDYLIVNDSFDIALGQLRSILVAERLKVARLRPTKSTASLRQEPL